MKLYLDDSATEVAPASNEHIAGMVRDYLARASLEGRVLAHTWVDDFEVDNLAEALRAKPASDTTSVKVVTTTPEALVSEALESAKSYLPELVRGIDALARRIVQGKSAADGQAELLEGIQWVSMVLRGVLDYGSLASGRRPQVEELCLRLHQSVEELSACWDRQDQVGLSDTLQFSLLPVMQDLSSLCSMLLEDQRQEESNVDPG